MPAASTSSATDAAHSSTVSVIGSADLPARPGKSIARNGDVNRGTSRSQNPDDDAPPCTNTNVMPSAIADVLVDCAQDVDEDGAGPPPLLGQSAHGYCGGSSPDGMLSSWLIEFDLSKSLGSPFGKSPWT